MIKLRSLPVLRGQLQMVKYPAMIKELRYEFGQLRQLQSQNFGTIRLHFRAFQRIVINKNETVQTQPQFVGEGFEVFGLGTPVDPASGEVLPLQRQVPTLLENGGDILLVILAAQAERHARLRLRPHE